MKKIITPAMGSLLLMALSSNLYATDTQFGEIKGYVKALTVLDGKDNGYDPNSGAAYLLALKYQTPKWHNLHIGVGFYHTNDLFGITDPESERVARGLFVTDDLGEKSLIGELYLNYTADTFNVYGGRMNFKSPLTTNAASSMPNFHTVYGVKAPLQKNLKLSLAQITHIAFGARAMTDFGLIGEGTGTAGANVKPSLLGQAEFHKISQATVGKNAESTNGISVAHVDYTLSGTKLSLWNYYADDITNTLYIEAAKKVNLSGNQLRMKAQYLTQSEQGESLAGERDYQLTGAKVCYGNKKWGTYVAYNKSFGDTAMLNAWAGDPAYTSSIFSRNAYRQEVSAYKVGAKYKLLNTLTLKASYANYGKSETAAPLKVLKAGSSGKTLPFTDAKETDIVLVYKPKKNITFKVFHAKRTSEYSGINGKELTQAHTRAIFSYHF
jgi:hypothetical protein